MSKINEIYQQIWLKAYKEGEVILSLNSKKEANRVRFSLYNAVKAVKASATASILKEAAENCSIKFIDEKTLCVQSAMNDPLLQNIAAIVGQDLTDIKPHGQGALTSEAQIDKDALESLERVLDKLKQDDTGEAKPKRITPYYERD